VIYVVLGMHKCGTTLVARLLHESGIDMGDFDAELGYGDGNHYERRATQEANRRLLHGLQLPPLDYLLRRPLRPPVDAAGYAINRDSQAYVRYRALARRLDHPEAARELQAVVASCAAEGEDWGFKDPRTSLTYAAWRRALPPHRIVVVFRALGQLLGRTRGGARHPLRALRVVHAWTVYNWMIVRQLEAADQPWIALRYEQLMAGAEPLERLGSFVGRPLRDARDPRLYRTREATKLPAWVQAARPLLPIDPVELEARLDGLVS
jgi:hypothetical protein